MIHTPALFIMAISIYNFIALFYRECKLGNHACWILWDETSLLFYESPSSLLVKIHEVNKNCCCGMGLSEIPAATDLEKSKLQKKEA
jgi:hypothetical protein